MDARTWTVPAERMKRRIAHTVPLSAAALDCLRRIREHNGADMAQIKHGRIVATYLFHGVQSDTRIGSGTTLRTLQAMGAKDEHGKPATVHGFRSSFRVWAAERGEDRMLSEMCLAHDVRGSMERTYSRTELVELRREIMQRWGEHCAG